LAEFHRLLLRHCWRQGHNDLKMRRIAVTHDMVAFLFNTVILVLTINMASRLP
jgi:hypothetical protein